MKKLAQIASISVLVAGLSSGHAKAATFTETGDAGETLSTAQVIPSEAQLLESISGTLSGDADLFKIFLTGSQTFSATTVGGTDFDTRLFLFDADGFGVYFNEDASSTTVQSTLPANSQFTPTQSGIYYLGISAFDYNPVSAEGNIFPTLADFPVDVPLESILTGVFEPTGGGGESSLSGFDGAILDSGGSYTIALTGVETGDQTGGERVPEPASALGLLAFGAWGASRIKNKKNKQQTC